MVMILMIVAYGAGIAVGIHVTKSNVDNISVKSDDCEQ
jgi:hypothetical protein